MMPGPWAWLTLLVMLAGGLGMLGTSLARRYALSRDLLDHPNDRSSHAHPTPRGGGVAIVAGYAVSVTLWSYASGAEARQLWLALAPAGLAIAALGMWDDRRPIPAGIRLPVHVLAAGWVVGWLGGMATLPWPGQEVALGPAGGVLAILALSWFLNLFNFMDGIDGLAASEAVFIAAAAAFIGGPQSPAFLPLLALAAASAGFLTLNWPPARIFMGDVGSGFLGITLAGLLLAQHSYDAVPIGASIALTGVFVADATTALFIRMARGERLHEAHRSHAYQRCARRFASHRRVSVTVLMINLFYLLPMALLAANHPSWSLLIGAAAIAPLFALAFVLGAGRPDEP